MIESEYITGTKRLARFINMDYNCAVKYVKEGIIPRRKLGRSNIFKISEVKAAISDITNQKSEAVAENQS